MLNFQKDVKFHHSRFESFDSEELLPHGGSTIAYYIDYDNKKLFAAIAICSDSDLFCKETGRKLALERLTKKIMSNESSFNNDGKPLTVTFTEDDINRWIEFKYSASILHYMESINSMLYKNTEHNLEYTVKFPKASMKDFKMGMLISKLVDFFQTYYE